MSTTPDPIREARNRQHEFQDKAFRMMFRILLVFGIPAFVAFLAGRALDTHFNTGKVWILSLLVVAFLSSWTMVIKMYKKLSEEARAVDEQMRRAKEESKETTTT